VIVCKSKRQWSLLSTINQKFLLTLVAIYANLLYTILKLAVSATKFFAKYVLKTSKIVEVKIARVAKNIFHQQNFIKY